MVRDQSELHLRRARDRIDDGRRVHERIAIAEVPERIREADLGGIHLEQVERLASSDHREAALASLTTVTLFTIVGGPSSTLNRTATCFPLSRVTDVSTSVSRKPRL